MNMNPFSKCLLLVSDNTYISRIVFEQMKIRFINIHDNDPKNQLCISNVHVQVLAVHLENRMSWL